LVKNNFGGIKINSYLCVRKQIIMTKQTESTAALDAFNTIMKQVSSNVEKDKFHYDKLFPSHDGEVVPSDLAFKFEEELHTNDEGTWIADYTDLTYVVMAVASIIANKKAWELSNSFTPQDLYEIQTTGSSAAQKKVKMYSQIFLEIRQYIYENAPKKIQRLYLKLID
jgi:hypothetical protein